MSMNGEACFFINILVTKSRFHDWIVRESLLHISKKDKVAGQFCTPGHDIDRAYHNYPVRASRFFNRTSSVIAAAMFSA